MIRVIPVTVTIIRCDSSVDKDNRNISIFICLFWKKDNIGSEFGKQIKKNIYLKKSFF